MANAIGEEVKEEGESSAKVGCSAVNCIGRRFSPAGKCNFLRVDESIALSALSDL